MRDAHLSRRPRTEEDRCGPTEGEERGARPARARWPLCLGLGLLLCFCSCVNIQTERGVADLWSERAEEAFLPGRTTRSAVLEMLGPPSQVITMDGGSAFYYLLEKTDSKGLYLLLYNTRTEQTRYERAVFFFDAEGVLTDYATR